MVVPSPALFSSVSPRISLYRFFNRTDGFIKVLAVEHQALVRVEKPLRISDRSEPQPDIAIVHVHPYRYADGHPNPDQVYLLIEVSDSSLDYDCDTKAKPYAQAEIDDYWVLDAKNRQLHVFRDPNQGTYQQCFAMDEDAYISPLTFSDVQVDVKEMLPPVVEKM